MYFSPSYYVSLGRRCFPGLLETLRRREKDGRQQAEAAATAICVKMGDGTHVVDLLCVCFSSFLSSYIYIHDIYNYYVMSYYIILYYIMLCYVSLYYVILYHILLCYVILHYITSYYIILHYIIWFIYTYIYVDIYVYISSGKIEE